MHTTSKIECKSQLTECHSHRIYMHTLYRIVKNEEILWLNEYFFETVEATYATHKDT